jgi:hypothetical protein
MVYDKGFFMDSFNMGEGKDIWKEGGEGGLVT